LNDLSLNLNLTALLKWPTTQRRGTFETYYILQHSDFLVNQNVQILFDIMSDYLLLKYKHPVYGI